MSEVDTYKIVISLLNDKSSGLTYHYSLNMDKGIPKAVAEHEVRYQAIHCLDKCLEDYIKPRITLTIVKSDDEFLDECHPYAKGKDGLPVPLPDTSQEAPQKLVSLLDKARAVAREYPGLAGYMRADMERLEREEEAEKKKKKKEERQS